MRLFRTIQIPPSKYREELAKLKLKLVTAKERNSIKMDKLQKAVAADKAKRAAQPAMPRNFEVVEDFYSTFYRWALA